MALQATSTKNQVACPYCGGEATFLLSSTDRNRHTTTEAFDYYTCSQCGLVYMYSPPEDMAPYYRGGYESIPANLFELRKIAAMEKYRLEPILRYKKGGRFLEIGPWRGVLCCNMKDAGFAVTAIEMDTGCVNFLRNELGVEAIQSTDPAETMKGMKTGFDVITAWHSMEHLPNPWLVIEQAAKLLAPGGILLLAMPNPDSYEFSVLKGRWMHLDTPRHLYFFTIKLLERICAKDELTLLEVTTSDKFSKIQSEHAWMTEARSWIPIRYVRGVLAKTAGRLLYRLAYRRQMVEGKGSGYTAVFVRGS
jgi:2-polyprenyl-3-methyl-5-hydroxy-6-metoxy-1,4-benzoquinol methylase